MNRLFNNYNDIYELTDWVLNEYYKSDFNAVNFNDKDNVVIEINALGFNKEDIEISVDKNRYLTVTSKKEKSKSKLASDIRYKTKLGETLNEENIKASLDLGVLTLKIEKRKQKEFTKKVVID